MEHDGHPIPSLRTAIITAVFGGYDSPTQYRKQDLPCDFFCFVDKASASSPHWKPVQDENHQAPTILLDEECGGATSISPTLKGIRYRCFPFDIPQLKDYDVIIYLDGNVRITEPTFLHSMFELGIGEHSLSAPVHPWRDCAYAEATASMKVGKYDTIDLPAQIAFYRKEGFPEHAGLYWNGFLCWNRRKRTATSDAFGQTWFDEMMAYHRPWAQKPWPQGQVSMPYAAWKVSFPIHRLPSLYPVSPHGLHVANHGA